MKCSLCGFIDRKKTFLTTSCNHKNIHEECIYKYFDQLSLNKCKMCRVAVEKFMDKKKNLCTSCQTRKVLNKNSQCDKQNTYCLDCLKRLKYNHIKQCYSCKNLAKEEICQGCKNHPGFSIEICPDHFYCKQCVKSYNKSSNHCGYCFKFFSILHNVPNPFCSRCQKFYLSTEFLCPDHGYCENCITCLKNQRSFLNRELNCNSCENQLEVKKYQQEEKDQISRGNMDYLMLKNEHRENEVDLKRKRKTGKISNFIQGMHDIWGKKEKKQIKNEDKEKCSSCQKSPQEKIICTTLGICIECVAKHQPLSHGKSCKFCFNFIKNCERCSEYFENEALFLTPTCKIHSYCEFCLSREKKSYSTSDCQNCIKYFTMINFTLKSGQIQCNLCTNLPINNFKCSADHEYCKNCLEFLLENDFSKYQNIKNCCYCYEMFTKLKNLDKTPVEIKKNPEESKQEEYPVKKLNKKNQVWINQEESDEDEDEEMQKANYKDQRWNNQKKLEESEHMQVDPSPSSIIKNSDDFQQPYSNIVPSYLSNTNPNYLSNNLSISPQPIAATISSIPKEDYYEKFPESQTYTHNITSQNYYYSNTTISYESVENSCFQPLCSLCKSDKNVYGFMCNHNYCLECLSLTGGKQILSNFQLLKTNENAYKVKFRYYCKVQKCDKNCGYKCGEKCGKLCGKEMKIPTQMILLNLKSMISDQNKIMNNKELFESASEFSDLFQNCIENMIFFYDGMLIKAT